MRSVLRRRSLLLSESSESSESRARLDCEGDFGMDWTGLVWHGMARDVTLFRLR
jgi:hypothetical protein